jgi:membrane-associated protease RseP (regulator of RpoE activity)
VLAIVAGSPAGPLPSRAEPPEQPLAATNVPGTGWLGLTVAESPDPGRWIVTAVTPQGPAETAGILVNDEIRAMHGRNLMSLDEVTQAITEVAAGQRVPVAMARGGSPFERVLVALPRPPRAGTSPGSRSSPAADVLATAGIDTEDRYARQPSGSRFQAAADEAPRASDPLPGDPASIPARAAPQPDRAPPPAVSNEPSNWAPARGGPPVATPTVPREPAVFPGPLPASRSRTRGRTALGVRTVPIDARTQARFRLARPSGAYVVGVVDDLPAWKAGVPGGSVIVAIGEQPVSSPEELTTLVVNSPVDRPVPIQYVLPGGEQKRANVVLQSLDLPMERALIGPEEAAPPSLRRAERPVMPRDDAEHAALRDEVRRLRERIDWLERRLGAIEPRTP